MSSPVMLMLPTAAMNARACLRRGPRRPQYPTGLLNLIPVPGWT